MFLGELSQNHRTVETGRDLWRSSGSNPLHNRHCRKPDDAQDHVQTGSEYLQGQRLYNLSGQTVPVFDHSHSKNWFVFRLNFMCFDLCLFFLSCHGMPKKRGQLPLWTFPSHTLDTGKIPTDLVKVRELLRDTGRNTELFRSMQIGTYYSASWVVLWKVTFSRKRLNFFFLFNTW